MKKIIIMYIQDSSEAAKIAEYLGTKLPDADVISPDIPIEPELALRKLNKLCYEERPDVIIGISMGAMYAQQMHGFRKILINPAFHVSDETKSIITEGPLNDYQKIESEQFFGITGYDRVHTHTFWGMDDKFQSGEKEKEWMKKHLLPCVKRLLKEEEDTENINAEKMYELLARISEGGKSGHQAYEELWRACYPDYFEIANLYPDFHNPMTIMKAGFKKAVNSFVYDFEELPYRSFSKHSYIEVKSHFSEAASMKVYRTYVDKGRKMDPMHAMKLMTKFYIENCGVSLGERTLAYDAGSAWLKKYIEDNPRRTEWDEHTSFTEVMPVICKEYDVEVYGHYDIVTLSIEEERNNAIDCAKELGEDVAAALCYGIEYLYRSASKHHLYLLYKVLIKNGNRLDTSERAIFYHLDDAEAEMQKWTEHNREHLLCFIIREVTPEKAFRDELASSFCNWPDEPYIEDLDNQEYVYMPSGFKRALHLNVGDLVKYIYHDADVTVLKWGCIAKLPSKRDNSVLILDSKKTLDSIGKKTFAASCVKVPERYVFHLTNIES